MNSHEIATRAVTPVEDLAKLLRRPGPFATAAVRSDVEIPNAAAETARHWRVARRALDAQGATSEALDALEDAIVGRHDRGPTIIAIADGDASVLVEDLDHPIDNDHGWLAPLPRLGSIIEDRQSRVPYVLVVADRVGADIAVVRASGAEEIVAAEGQDHPITKVRQGGWSHRRMQQRAENTWDRNAAGVADEVTRIARGVQPRLVFLAGDVRAVELLSGHLPAELRERTIHVDATRAAGGDAARTSEEIERELATLAAADTTALLRTFKEEVGQADRAVDGPEATLRALARGQVSDLLVHDDPDDERTAWFGADLFAVGAQRGDLDGSDSPTEGRLVDVSIRAALGTGARVRVVPAHGGPTESIGALLRWAD